MKKVDRRTQAWSEARQRYRLTHAQVQMARELGINPAKLGTLANHRQQPWKAPLPRFIEALYQKRFGKTLPDIVVSIEERARHDREKQELRRTARRERARHDNTGDRRWVEGRNFRLADEIQYIQRRAAERNSRVVTIGPLLLFSTESGDAWVVEPANRLATRVADAGDPRPVHIEETEKSFAVGWRGRYEIQGSAFVFRDDESGRVTAILGYPIREIANRIADVMS